MTTLLVAGGYLYTYKDSSGFVFAEDDISSGKDGDNILPIMVVKLRESPINGWKQAHGLRIREHYSDESVTKNWYLEYVRQVSPIISDTDHVQGGFMLWQHFIKAPNLKHFSVKAWNIQSNHCICESVTIKDTEQFWSKYPDTSRSNVVLSLELKEEPSEERSLTLKNSDVLISELHEVLTSYQELFDSPDDYQLNIGINRKNGIIKISSKVYSE